MRSSHGYVVTKAPTPVGKLKRHHDCREMRMSSWASAMIWRRDRLRGIEEDSAIGGRGGTFERVGRDILAGVYCCRCCWCCAVALQLNTIKLMTKYTPRGGRALLVKLKVEKLCVKIVETAKVQ